MSKDYSVKVRLDAFEADCFSVDDGVLEVDLIVGGEDAFDALQSATFALSEITHFVSVKECNE